jgi:hypothetical protein
MNACLSTARMPQHYAWAKSTVDIALQCTQTACLYQQHTGTKLSLQAQTKQLLQAGDDVRVRANAVPSRTRTSSPSKIRVTVLLGLLDVGLAPKKVRQNTELDPLRTQQSNVQRLCVSLNLKQS